MAGVILARLVDLRDRYRQWDFSSGVLADKGIHIQGIWGAITALEDRVRTVYAGTSLAGNFEHAQTNPDTVDGELAAVIRRFKGE